MVEAVVVPALIPVVVPLGLVAEGGGAALAPVSLGLD
jgi:hypothetical protein